MTRNIDLDSHDSSDKNYSRNSQKILNKFNVSLGYEVKIVTKKAEYNSDALKSEVTPPVL